jgi:hypothetical protein
MFEETRREATHKKLSLSGKKMFFLYGAVIVCLGIILVLLIAISRIDSSSVTIPDAITEKTKSSIYLPKELPGNYAIDESSFSLVEEGTVLIFEAKDGAGAKLIFSEQPRSESFDFEEFYKKQLSDAKTLNDVPFPSVWGKSMDGRLTLSIVTPETWILMVTPAPLDGDDMSRVAASIQKH